MNKYSAKTTIEKTSFFSTFIEHRKNGKKKLSLRAKRWFVTIGIHLIFFLSFYIDIQMLEGTLNGSRFFGFHLIDLFTTIEVYVATYHLSINMLIGTITIALFYIFLGGRTYCSWVCPYGLLSEIGEKINNTLINKGIIRKKEFDNRVKYLFYLFFLISSFSSGYLVFETINVIGIMSRFIVYGWSLALIWVLIIFLFEIFYSRRVWCRCVCPIGATYGYLGAVAALRVEWSSTCDHCMVCHDVCFENQVLEVTKSKYAKQVEEHKIETRYVSGMDCTLCGRCIDVCHQDALKFDFRLKGLI